MSEQAIVLNELTKHYGKHRGINNLSFSVNQGEFFGFIGPNGAGKSTILSEVQTGNNNQRKTIQYHSYHRARRIDAEPITR